MKTESSPKKRWKKTDSDFSHLCVCNVRRSEKVINSHKQTNHTVMCVCRWEITAPLCESVCIWQWYVNECVHASVCVTFLLTAVCWL